MTTHPDQARLHDYADGLLPAEEARGVEAHLAGCGACRRRVHLLRDLMRELRALPREIVPPRDLRPPVIPEGDAGARHPRRSTRAGHHGSAAPPKPGADGSPVTRRRGRLGPRLRVAAGIVALVGAAAAVVWLAADGPAGRGAVVADAPAAGAAEAVAGAVPLEPYSEATRDLLSTFRARHGQLPPEAVRLIRRNLAVVDAAIRELERARARAPGDARIPRLLEARYRTKLELLRDAVALLSKA